MNYSSFAMTPETDNPTPDPDLPKPRPLAGDAKSGRVESDLWDLDSGDAEAPPGVSALPVAKPEPKEEKGSVVRKWTPKAVSKQSPHKKESRKESGVRLDIQAKAAPRRPDRPPLPVRRVEKEFTHLEDWDVAPVDASPEETKKEDAAPAGEYADAPSDSALVAPSEVDRGEIEPDVSAKPQSSGKGRQKLAHGEEKGIASPMKVTEWAGLVVLGLFLVGLLAAAYFWSIHQLPEKTPRWQEVSFPVKGERVEIKNADTYWRAPVLEGPNKDPIRRGTRLIPVVELQLAGGNTALRVIFRDDEGRGVGDPIIRSVSSSGKLVVAATAGFEDPGMHAAYRTEELEPWTVEVSEAASADSPGSEFSLILETNLSPELR